MLNLPSVLFHFVIYVLFIQHVLCAGPSVKHLTDNNLFDLCNHPVGKDYCYPEFDEKTEAQRG